jgi:hypothetical protein
MEVVMRRFFAGLIAAAFVVVAGAPAFARTATIKGQLVDQECYLMEKKVEADSACAVSCAKAGKPVALLTSDGKVYEVTGGLAANKNAKLAEHMLKTVEITGDVTETAGKLSIAADALKLAK